MALLQRRRSSTASQIAHNNNKVPRRRSSSDFSRESPYKRLLETDAKTLFAFVVSLALLSFSILSPRTSSSQGTLTRNDNASTRPVNLHILIPASRPDVNLCKLLLSAAVLGYPTPVIINWNQTFDSPDLVEGGSHLAKITGVHEYLHALDDTHDNDLVLMVDGYDVWMQLRPQTLLDRYFGINRRADERILSEIGDAPVKRQGIRQEIVFGCQKRCWPWTPDDPPCYAVPNSTLPIDIFGPRTDAPSNEDQNPYRNYRPRFLVSGTAIGPVRALRKLFDQALVQLESESNFGSDQYIFSHIFGDQEIWREAVRRESGRNDRLHGHFNEQHIKEVQLKAAGRPDGKFEFGIGVDYKSEIVLNTVFAEEDTEWLAMSDTSPVQAAQENHNVSSTHRWDGLASDIGNTLPPFWTFSQEDVPRWTSWQDVPLLTNVFTGIQPAVIHHNAHRDGLKSRRETWWPLIWFEKHARTLLDASIYAPVIPVAEAGYDEHTLRKYWTYEIWKGGAVDGIKGMEYLIDGWIRFDDVCRDYHEEVFRDGKGAWELPDAH